MCTKKLFSVYSIDLKIHEEVRGPNWIHLTAKGIKPVLHSAGWGIVQWGSEAQRMNINSTYSVDNPQLAKTISRKNKDGKELNTNS